MCVRESEGERDRERERERESESGGRGIATERARRVVVRQKKKFQNERQDHTQKELF